MSYAAGYFDSGAFLADLTRRVAFRTESQVAGQRPDLRAYLEQEMVPVARRLGATTRQTKAQTKARVPRLPISACPSRTSD